MKTNTEVVVPGLVSSHFLANSAECVGEADSIKALDRNAKALKNVHRASSVLEESRWSRAGTKSGVQ